MHSIGFGNNFMAMTPEAQVIKKKDYLDFFKIKNFCALKDTIKKDN